MSCGRRDYRNDIIGRPGNDDGYWLNLVDARVGAVQQTRHPVGTDFAGYVPPQLFYEFPAVSLNVFGKHGHVWRIDCRTQVCLTRIVGSNCTLPTKVNIGSHEW